MANEIRLKLTIDGKEAIATLEQSELAIGENEEASERLDDSFQDIISIGVGNFLADQFANALSAIGSLISGSEELFAIQEQAEARVRGMIRATSDAAGFSAEELFDMASQLQEVTRFGDEAILNAQSRLLTFQNIHGDTFERATRLSLDLAEVTGDVDSAMKDLGRTLENPIEGLTGLNEMGIIFNDEQEQRIKQLVEENKTYEAQAAILDVVQSRVGGLAEEMASTRTGSIEQFNNTMGDMQEVIGGIITDFKVGALPMLESFVGVLSDYMTVPTSEKMRDEQVQLNVLVNRITATNTKQEDRNKLINDLQDRYPDFLSNLDAESVSNEELAGRLSEVNEQMINRIVIQQQEEEIQKVAEKAATARTKRQEEKIALEDQLAEANIKYNLGLDLTNSTLEENTEKVQAAMKAESDHLAAIDGRDAVVQSITDSYWSYNGLITRATNLEEELNDVTEFANELLEVMGINQDENTEKQKESNEAVEDAINLNKEKIDQERSLTKVQSDLRAQYDELINQQGTLTDSDRIRLGYINQEIEAIQRRMDKRQEQADAEASHRTTEEEFDQRRREVYEEDTNRRVNNEMKTRAVMVETGDSHRNMVNQMTEQEAALLRFKIESAEKFGATFESMNADQIDSFEELGKVVIQELKQMIGAEIRMGVASAIRSTLASAGPLGLILAPAAGLAAQVMFNKVISAVGVPEFATGGLVRGGEQIVRLNEDGEEFVMNAESTRNMKPMLEAANANPNLGAEMMAFMEREAQPHPRGLIEANNFNAANGPINISLVNNISSRHLNDELEVYREEQREIGNEL